MYPADYETATSTDVVAHSITTHPRAFREHLNALADLHRKYRDECAQGGGLRRSEAARAANTAWAHCVEAVAIWDAGLAKGHRARVIAKAMCHAIGPRIQSLTVAFKLQEFPVPYRGDVAGRR